MDDQRYVARTDPPGSPIQVLVRRIDTGVPLPRYATVGDAGADLHARVDVHLGPGDRAVVPTGIALALPAGYAGFIHPRSGLAARHGVTTVNAPGTIDAGYRGEIMVALLNTDRRDAVQLRRGDRIAQLVLQRVDRADFAVVDELPDSDRGSAGLGSTGGWSGAAEPPRAAGAAESPRAAGAPVSAGVSSQGRPVLEGEQS
ncbi:MAG: dUTP diphosphatase [Angustibacter sp.]